MKKNLIKTGLMVLAMMATPMCMNAQLNNILNKVNQISNQVNQAKNTASNATATGTSTAAQIQNILGKLKGSDTAGIATDMVAKLLGDTKLTQSTVVGTWSYNKPCVAFNSESTLADLGGTVVSNKLENKMNTALTKAGIAGGKMSITFNDDNTFSMLIGKKKQVTGTYTINGSDITLNFNSPKKTVVANAKITLGTMQLAMEANGLFNVVSTVATKAAAFSTQMSSLSSLISNYDGMYLGMELIKQ